MRVTDDHDVGGDMTLIVLMLVIGCGFLANGDGWFSFTTGGCLIASAFYLGWRFDQ